MLGRSPLPHLFLENVLEAEQIVLVLAKAGSSIDQIIAQTREAIAESRRIIAEADKLLER
jgi:hypothetical protein